MTQLISVTIMWRQLSTLLLLLFAIGSTSALHAEVQLLQLRP
jgi:hypothetical protein